jgi:hypothetical protein
VLMVAEQRCVRRCNNCDHSATTELPKPSKKVIYLDQNAISLMVKVSLGRAPEKWNEVRAVLEDAVIKEAIVCPHSEFHETESLMDKKFAEELRKLYQRLALGEKVCTTYEIEMAQIARALKRFAKEPERERPDWRDILRRDPHVWTGDMYITLNTGRLDAAAVTARMVKDQITARLDDLNTAFKANKKTFEEQRALEIAQVAANMAEIYKRHLAKLMGCSNPSELLTVHMEGSIFTEQMQYVLDFFKKRGADDKARVRGDELRPNQQRHMGGAGAPGQPRAGDTDRQRLQRCADHQPLLALLRRHADRQLDAGADDHEPGQGRPRPEHGFLRPEQPRRVHRLRS